MPDKVARIHERRPMFKSNCLLALLATTVAAFATGCSSTPETLNDRVAEVNEWWNDPGAIRDTLAVVGMAPVGANKAFARNRAEVDARNKMAATARAKIESLATNWAKETGDMFDERTRSSWLNDELLIRQFTNAEIIGARAAKMKEMDGYVYVLMVIDDPAKWTQQVGSSLKDKMLKDETMFKTEVMKRDFEEKLDKLIERDSAAAEDAKQKFEQNYVK